MERVLSHVILGRSTIRIILRRAVKKAELQSVGHIYIYNCMAFSVGFDSQRLPETWNGKVYGWAVIGPLLEDDDHNTIIAAKIIGSSIQVETAKGQEADHETIGIVTSRHRQPHWYSNLGW